MQVIVRTTHCTLTHVYEAQCKRCACIIHASRWMPVLWIWVFIAKNIKAGEHQPWFSPLPPDYCFATLILHGQIWTLCLLSHSWLVFALINCKLKQGFCCLLHSIPHLFNFCSGDREESSEMTIPRQLYSIWTTQTCPVVEEKEDDCACVMTDGVAATASCHCICHWHHC